MLTWPGTFARPLNFIRIEALKGIAETADSLIDDGQEDDCAMMGTTELQPCPPPRPKARAQAAPRRSFDLEGSAAPDLASWDPATLVPPPSARATRPLPVPRAALAKLEHDGNSSMLSRYFRDMALHPVLGPAEELDAARAVEDREIAHWVALLSLPSIATHLLAVLQQRVDEAGAERVQAPHIHEMVQLAARWLKRGKLFRSQQLRYTGLSRYLARAVRLPDSDRAWMTEARQIAHHLVRTPDPENDADPVLSPEGELDEVGIPSWRSLPRLPDSDEVRAYLARVEETHQAQRDAKSRFVKANLRLVVTLAHRYDRGQLPFIDLIQEGNLGLLKAVEQFDLHRGYRFSTYASWWIRHALGRGVADRGRAVRLPVHVLDAHHRAERHRQALLARNGREPTLDELAYSTGMPAEKLRVLESVRADAPLSLDRPLANEDERRPIDALQDEDALSPFDEVATRAWSEQVPHLLAGLTPVESRILRLRFGLDDGNEQTLQEIGDRCHVSRERIRQLQARALDKLRKQMKADLYSDQG
jgi:RNA polymerase primary sigma factor